MKKVSTDKVLIEIMDKKLRNAFEKDKYEVRDIIMNVGNVFGVDVDICFWIIQKKQR